MEQVRTYKALLFKQRLDSPLQAAFVAPSSEVDSWARVPTKKTGNIRNFQRAQIPKHVQEVERFFGNASNASPTAVVVGFDQLRAKGRVATLGPNGKQLQDEPIPPGQPVLGEIKITWEEDPDPETESDLRTAIGRAEPKLRALIHAELADLAGVDSPKLNELLQVLIASAQSVEEAGDTEPQEGESAGAAVGNGAPADELAQQPEIEIPDGIKTLMPGLSPSEQQVVVGRLLFLCQAQASQLAKYQVQALRDLYSEVRDELKPAILIDGQHRILGTKKLGNIPFLVTALPDAAWPELAFQFIVTNRTARRVPESLLISIVGNSLSKQQRGAIEGRLREANIHVGLIEAVMRVHEDEQSPFFGMIAFGLKSEDGFLDAAAMRGKVIQQWYERQHPLPQLFEHVCQGKRKAERTEFWKDEDLWFEYFVAFWNAVRDRYENSNVFSSELVTVKGKAEPASKLMSATVLMIFQDTVLEHLHGYLVSKQSAEKVPISVSLPDAKKFHEMVKNTIAPLTPDFFTEWQLSGFDGSVGAKRDLADALNKVIKTDSGWTVAKLKKSDHRLFKAEGKGAGSGA